VDNLGRTRRRVVAFLPVDWLDIGSGTSRTHLRAIIETIKVDIGPAPAKLARGQSLLTEYVQKASKYSALNFSVRHCALFPTPHITFTGKSLLAQCCPKNGDLPKSPFPAVAAVVPIGWHDNTLK
jgi:hypothetical protein